jgi:hypothetical protein
MFLRFPKDNKRFRWTRHIKNKMLFYNLSEQRIRSVLHSPNRREAGIAPNTVAVMKRNDTKKRKEEIWVMYQSKGGEQPGVGGGEAAPRDLLQAASDSQKIMISAWRYPGHTKPDAPIPIPEEMLEELNAVLLQEQHNIDLNY